MPRLLELIQNNVDIDFGGSCLHLGRKAKGIEDQISRAMLFLLLILASLFPHIICVLKLEWGTATLIETNSFKPPANLCKLAVNQNGDAMAVWQQGDSSGVSSIWANRYNAASGRWRTATLIESNAGKAFLPHVGMDDNGNAIAVWVQNDGTYDSMWANRYVAGQGWGTPELIETNTGDADFARVAVNGNGVAVALWKQSNGVNHDIWSNIMSRAKAGAPPR